VVQKTPEIVAGIERGISKVENCSSKNIATGITITVPFYRQPFNQFCQKLQYKNRVATIVATRFLHDNLTAKLLNYPDRTILQPELAGENAEFGQICTLRISGVRTCSMTCHRICQQMLERTLN
jgi:hypothetical protein